MRNNSLVPIGDDYLPIRCCSQGSDGTSVARAPPEALDASARHQLLHYALSTSCPHQKTLNTAKPRGRP